MDQQEEVQRIITAEDPLKAKAERLKSLGLNQRTIASRLQVTEARISQLIGKRRVKREQVA